MSKPKSLVKQGKSRKQKDQPPETVDEFQAAGVDAEESGGKHRAGDGAKSMRFFTKAIDIYETGLRKFPHSFDLAYNKARVQYEVATSPVLVRQAQVPVPHMLEIALASHRYALQLKPDDPDTLFNTAGVLTTIAEEIARDASLPDARALELLEEALELQNRCLAIQEYMFEENQVEHAALMDASQFPQQESNDENQSPDAAADQPEEQWASIIEPVTKDTLLDTIEAQLSALTTLCSILGSSPGSVPASTLAWIEEYSAKLLNVKAPAYLEGTTDRLYDMAFVKANFVSTFLEAGFRSGKLDPETYKRERDAAFAAPEMNLANSSASLLADARSLIAFNSALAETTLVDIAPLSSMRWNALAAALADLTKAAKLPDTPAEDLPKTHLLRGDVSMSQYQLSKPSTAYPAAVSNVPSLLKNAEVFYRNASKLTKDDEERKEALLKEALAIFVQDKAQGSAKIHTLSLAQGSSWIAAQVDDLITEGLLSTEDVQGLSSPPWE